MANMTATYNGNTIASIESGESATLHCGGLRMKSDITLSVSECPGKHVIEVDKLPTQDIDGNALYKCGETYYEVLPVFGDIVVVESSGGRVHQFMDDVPEGITAECYTIPDKSAEGVKVSDLETTFYFYYVESERDIFVYTGEWVRFASIDESAGNCNGAIGNISEATKAGYYALMTYTFKALSGGGGGGGGAELNIAYGDTAPEDTSKMWVKTEEPNKVTVSMFGSDGVTDSFDEYGRNTGTISTDVRHCYNCCAKVGSYVYSFGGYRYRNDTNSYKSSYIFKYTATGLTSSGGTATKLSATVPVSGERLSCAAVGTKIYLFGGTTARASIYCFDTETETMTTLSVTLPVANYEMGCASVGSRIYLFGGYATPSTICCFDTETETITTLSITLPQACFAGSCVAVGLNIYLIGGFTSSTGALDCIQRFDVEKQTIVKLNTKLSTARFQFGCAVAGDNIVVCGGSTGVSTDGKKYEYVKTIEIYDVASDKIRTSSSTVTKPLGICCATHPFDGESIIIMGGTLNSFTTSSNYPIGYDTYFYYFTPSKSIALEAGTLFVRCTTANVDKKWEALKGDTLNVILTPLSARKGNAEGVGKQVEACLYVNDTWTTV